MATTRQGSFTWRTEIYASLIHKYNTCQVQDSNEEGEEDTNKKKREGRRREERKKRGEEEEREQEEEITGDKYDKDDYRGRVEENGKEMGSKNS